MRRSKKIFSYLVSAVMSLVLIAGLFPQVTYAAASTYVHNPLLNAKAMQDIVVDENAVYGFRPDPSSERLGAYADMDWSDPETVEKGKQERIAYHDQFKTMYDTWNSMKAQGKSIEEIARTVSNMRNEIRTASYANDPEGLAKMKESNLEKYGNENGPTADSLYEKYGSWETVLIKSFSENPGMDACLGLYDTYYDNYVSVGSLIELSQQTFTVRENDNLSKLAAKYYGDSTQWRKIYDLNTDIISNPNIIYAGQELIISVE